MSDRFDVPADCSVELSPLGYQFFTDTFEIFDKVYHIARYILVIFKEFDLGPGWSSQNVGARRGFQYVTGKSMGTAKVPRHYIIRRHWSGHFARLVSAMEVSICFHLSSPVVDNAIV